MALVFGLPVLFGSIGTFLVTNSYVEEEDDIPKAPEPSIFETIFPHKPEKPEPTVFESVFSSRTEPEPAKPGMLESIFPSTPVAEEVPAKPGMMESMFSTTPKAPEVPSKPGMMESMFSTTPKAPEVPAKPGMMESMFSTTPATPVAPVAPATPQPPKEVIAEPYYEPIEQPGVFNRGVNSIVDFSKPVQDKAGIDTEKKLTRGVASRNLIDTKVVPETPVVPEVVPEVVQPAAVVPVVPEVVPEVVKPTGAELGAIQARKDIQSAKKFKLPVAHSPPTGEDEAEALLNDDLGLPLEPLKDMDLEGKQWGSVQVKPRGPRTRRNAFGQENILRRGTASPEARRLAEQAITEENERLAQESQRLIAEKAAETERLAQEAAVKESQRLIAEQAAETERLAQESQRLIAEQAAETKRLAQEAAVKESQRLVAEQAAIAEVHRQQNESLEAHHRQTQKAKRLSFEDLAKATKSKFDREEAERIKNQAIVAEGLRKAKELEESNKPKGAWDTPAPPIGEYFKNKTRKSGGRKNRSTR